MWRNVLLFQSGWCLCVMERGPLALAATPLLLLLHAYWTRGERFEWRVIAAVTLIGVIQDFTLIQLGVLQVSTQPWPPLWLVAIWLLFATTLNQSLRWLQHRYLLAAILGAIAGPLSYLAGERLGALQIDHDLLPVLSFTWGVTLPCFMVLNSLLRERNPTWHAH